MPHNDRASKTSETAFGISAADFAALRGVLAPYRDRIHRAAIFGSRATGRHRASSDIDLALYGDVDTTLLGRLRSEFIDSDVTLRVDVAAYGSICNDELRQHIDRFGIDIALQADSPPSPH